MNAPAVRDRVVVRGQHAGVVKGGEVDGMVFVRLDQGTQASFPVQDVVVVTGDR